MARLQRQRLEAPTVTDFVDKTAVSACPLSLSLSLVQVQVFLDTYLHTSHPLSIDLPTVHTKPVQEGGGCPGVKHEENT